MKRKRISIPAKYMVFFLILICGALIALSCTGHAPAFIRNIAGYVITPVQKCVTEAGRIVGDGISFFQDKEALLEENRSLKIQIAQLEDKNRELQSANDQVRQIQELYQLDNEYSQYPKLAASVIGRDSNNTFQTFLINKGSKDGLEVNMNVMAKGALVGKVIQVSDTWSKVRAIIDDSSNVSAMVADTGDYCVVSGKNNGSVSQLDFSQMVDTDENTVVGNRMVTSNVSDVYLPGLLIGYITECKKNEDNMTISGTISATADFEHLQSVMVITQLK